MSALKRTQAQFQRYVLGGDSGIFGGIAGPDDAFRKTRLEVYYNAYRLRLIEVLGSDFEKLKAFAGEDKFDAIARGYIDAHPSAFRNVRWFGGRLPRFLREDPRYRADPVLAELAEFEWTLGLAFDAEDAPALVFDDLAGLPADAWAGIAFHTHPSLHMLELRWNIPAIWNAIERNDAPPRPALAEQPVPVAVWRRDYNSHFRSLPADEAAMLRAAIGGASFPALCERLALEHGEDAAAARAAELLRSWVDQGWLRGYSLRQEDGGLKTDTGAPKAGD
jgi:hypothetical protein